MNTAATPPQASAPRPIFLSAEWRELVMLNYEVDPGILQPLVPVGTELDLWQDRALVSVVGFQFRKTRLRGLPIPFHRNFLEINLRFYVRRIIRNEVRRGVTFVREIVPRVAIARIAQRVYNEPYVALPMRGERTAERVKYEWRTKHGWHHLAASASGEPAIAPADSEATFITEHYWGYTRQRDGGTVEYEVRHPQWRVWNAESAELSAGAAKFYGEPFQEALGRKPCSAFIAEGSPVQVYAARRLKP